MISLIGFAALTAAVFWWAKQRQRNSDADAFNQSQHYPVTVHAEVVLREVILCAPYVKFRTDDGKEIKLRAEPAQYEAIDNWILNARVSRFTGMLTHQDGMVRSFEPDPAPQE